MFVSRDKGSLSRVSSYRGAFVFISLERTKGGGRVCRGRGHGTVECALLVSVDVRGRRIVVTVVTLSNISNIGNVVTNIVTLVT